MSSCIYARPPIRYETNDGTLATVGVSDRLLDAHGERTYD